MFRFLSVADSTPDLAREIVADFRRGEDFVSLAAIDADTAVAGDQAFAFIGGAAFSAAGQLRVQFAPEGAYLMANTTGSSGSEMMIFLRGVSTLGAADVFL
mgnify:CR=1 FL=1